MAGLARVMAPCYRGGMPTPHLVTVTVDLDRIAQDANDLTGEDDGAEDATTVKRWLDVNTPTQAVQDAIVAAIAGVDV